MRGVDQQQNQIRAVVDEVLRKLSARFDAMYASVEQSNNISCSVVPRLMDFPIPIHFFQLVADALQLFARVFSRESDEPLKYLHLAPLIQHNEVV